MLFVLAVSAGLVFYGQPKELRIQEIDVLPLETRAAVLPLLDDFWGKTFWEVSLRNIGEKIQQDHRFKSATIRREFPSRLVIQVQTRVPALAFLDESGNVLPVASDGTLLPESEKPPKMSYPLLRGREFANSQELRSTAVELVHSLDLHDGLTLDQISEIYFDRQKGFSLYLLGMNAEILMGHSDFGPKLERVQRVVSYLNSQNIKGRVIDARFTKKVVVRVRKSP